MNSGSFRLLRPYYEYNIEYFRNNISRENITFSISGGTFRRDANKFYFTPDNNQINNGTLILRTALPGMGWYGTIQMGIWNDRPTLRLVSYSYTIYKGPTTASGVLGATTLESMVYGTITYGYGGYTLSELDRLETSSPSLLLAITGSTINDNFYLNYVENATFYAENATSPYPLNAQVFPVFPTTSAAYYKITPTTLTSTITIRFATFNRTNL
jgi:hypothetical protein